MERGNGYFCGCCRNEYEVHEVQEWESDEDAQLYADRINKEWKINDVKIIAIYKLSNESPIFERN